MLKCSTFQRDSSLNPRFRFLALLIEEAEMSHQRLANRFLGDDALGGTLEGVELVVALSQVVEGGYGVCACGVYGFSFQCSTFQFPVCRDYEPCRSTDSLAVYRRDVLHECLNVSAFQLQYGEEVLEGRDAEYIASPHGSLRHGSPQPANVAYSQINLIA